MSARGQTVLKAKSLVQGDALYQRRAKKAFPILVRQACAWQPIHYSALAEELDMPNARNLNYVLGSVGQALREYGSERGIKIPPITCIVLNQQTRMPSAGVSWFMPVNRFNALTAAEKRTVVESQLHKIYCFPDWEKLLRHFSLEPLQAEAIPLLDKLRKYRRGKGEGPEHKALKARIAEHPELIGLPKAAGKGTIEYKLPSADLIDVLFEHQGKRIAVEVKSRISDEADLARGLFQCVKYHALLAAEMAVEGKKRNIRVCMVADRLFTKRLKELKNQLGIEVIELPARKKCSPQKYQKALD